MWSRGPWAPFCFQGRLTLTMTGCCAFGCSNRSENGHKMYRFPSDLERRKLWAIKVGRVGWKPSSTSFLCEEHFDARQFESKRADGKKKLKSSGVPTIFSHRRVCNIRKSPRRRSIHVSLAEGQNRIVLQDHNYTQPVGKGPNVCSSEEDGESESDAENVDPVGVPALGDKPVKTTEDRKNASEQRMRELKCELLKEKRKCKGILKSKAKQEAKISKIFGKDQLECLSRGSMKGVEWSSRTVKKALQLRFACGTTGYKALLQQSYPLPSERTLQRRMAHIPFQPGILEHVFDILKLKVMGLQEEERLCCLTLDEMSITPKWEFDVSSGSCLGSVTLPKHNGTADHALVFMLGGITTRWKQTVAYYFTSGSTDGTVFNDIVLNIIQRATDIGLHVKAVTSDMGSANRAMWRNFSVVCGRECKTVNRIPHPHVPDQWLYFLADVPHVFKNIKAAFVSGQEFVLSKNVVSEHNLPSPVVNVQPLQDIVNFQEDLDLKLAPKLTSEHLNPTHFDKMKVSNASSVFSQDVSCAVRYLVEKEGRSEVNLTTAWFIKLIRHWFDLMTSRHPILALSKQDSVKYREAVNSLNTVIAVFRGIKVGRGEWKPIQTGVILSTTSMLQLAEELLYAGHKFLLTSRLSQDCLENLFSVVRLRKPVPSPLEFKYALKLISSAQFLCPSRSGSYQQDDGEFLADFLDQDFRVPAEPQISNVDFSDKQNIQDLPQAECDSLFNLGGYCVRSIEKNEKTCTKCITEAKNVSGDDFNVHQAATLTTLKEYKKGCMVRISDKVYNMLLQVELMFRKAEGSFMEKTNIKKFLVARAEELCSAIELPACHNIKHKLLTKFINARLHFHCKKRTIELRKAAEKLKKASELGSKSMAMRKLAKNVK